MEECYSRSHDKLEPKQYSNCCSVYLGHALPVEDVPRRLPQGLHQLPEVHATDALMIVHSLLDDVPGRHQVRVGEGRGHVHEGAQLGHLGGEAERVLHAEHVGRGCARERRVEPAFTTGRPQA